MAKYKVTGENGKVYGNYQAKTPRQAVEKASAAHANYETLDMNQNFKMKKGLIEFTYNPAMEG